MSKFLRIQSTSIEDKKKNNKPTENYKKIALTKPNNSNRRKTFKTKSKNIEDDTNKTKINNKEEAIPSIRDSPKKTRNKSMLNRKFYTERATKRTSNSYEERSLEGKKITKNIIQNDKINNIIPKDKEENKKKIKKIKKKKEDNDDENDKKNKIIKKVNKNEKKKDDFEPPKIKNLLKKKIENKKNNKNEKVEKSNVTFTAKVNISKNEEKSKEMTNKNRNNKKLLTYKDRTLTSQINKKKNVNNNGIDDKESKKKKTAGKSVDKAVNRTKGKDKVKIALNKNKKKKKEESKSSSSSNSGSESNSESSNSRSSSNSKSSRSKSSKRSKSSSKSKNSKKSKNSIKSLSNSNNVTSSSNTSSSSQSDDDDEAKKTEILKRYNRSKTFGENADKVENSNNQNDKNVKNEKTEDKEKAKQDTKQMPNNVSSSNNGRKGSVILGSRYLRRRSMDNPLTRERLENLVNQMALKQNGGNTLFLRNYENGPSYQKEITIITKDKQTIKKNIKINECTKAGCSGPGIVKTNQDAYFVKENFLNNKDYLFIGVCDGHGEQGHVVSNYVINKLPSYIKDLSNESIIEAFKKINKEIYSSSKMDSNMSGTTVVSIIITPNNIICVNLGDSRASLFRYENGLYYCRNLSRDHKPCEPDESKRIINNGGRVKKCYDEEHKRFIGPDRVWVKNKEEPGLAMTRSLGDKIAHTIGVIDEPEFKTFNYDGMEKYIIIASDGLWEYVNGDQCINIVKPFYEEGKDSKEAALALVKEAFRKWKRKEVAIDDITVIVIFFD